MVRVADVHSFLQTIAPLELAESWDNVGLLVGRTKSPVHRIMTALTLVPENVVEAIEHEVDLVVVHHPLPFHALKRITDDTTPGRMLLDLIEAGISVLSLHTAWDNTTNGINEQLAKMIGLTAIAPLIAAKNPELVKKQLGSGRVGVFNAPQSLQSIAHIVQNKLSIDSISIVGEPSTTISRVGIVCGSGGSMVSVARDNQCGLFLTGEATFHQCLEAQSYGISMLLLGHFASEKFSMNHLGTLLAKQFPDVQVRDSKRESEPSGPMSPILETR